MSHWVICFGCLNEIPRKGATENVGQHSADDGFIHGTQVKGQTGGKQLDLSVATLLSAPEAHTCDNGAWPAIDVHPIQVMFT
eukprot:6589334-Lingulodinium_polyedra.AAC.1